MSDFLDSDIAGLTTARDAREQASPGEVAALDQVQAHVQGLWDELGCTDHSAQAEGAIVVLFAIAARAEAHGGDLAGCLSEMRMALAPLIKL